MQLLFDRLRAAGLRLGVDEALKLHYLLDLAGDADVAEQLRIVRAVVVKSIEDGEIFARVAEEWRPKVIAAYTSGPSKPADEDGPAGREAQRPPASPKLGTAVLLASIAAVALAYAIYVVQGVDPTTRPLDRADAGIEGSLRRDAGVAQVEDERTFTAMSPEIRVIPPEQKSWTLQLSLVLAALVPAPITARSRAGALRVGLSPPALRGARLLSRREEETAIWGIGRFVSDEPTPDLDVEKTIDETARADGFPTLHYQLRRHPREVWLWVDESAEQATAAQLARDLSATLSGAGLPVEVAMFWGVPDVLTTADGREFAPSEVDERRDSALVAILTDGRILSRQRDADQRWRRITALLRQLAVWPNLVFVDFARGAHNLGHYLGPFGISVVEPELVAAHLGGLAEATVALRTGTRETISGDVRAWAAACALAPSAIDEATAFSAKDSLGLSASPWAIELLRRTANVEGELLAWSTEARAELLRWLAEVDSDLFSRALEFWTSKYRDEDTERARRDALEPWLDTPAQRFLWMELALLELWREPERAARELYRLFQAREMLRGGAMLADSMRRALGALAPLELAARAEAVLMPWRFEGLSPEARVMLAEMGFGAGVGLELSAKVIRPGRQWIGAGIAAGLAVGFAIGMLFAVEDPPHDENTAPGYFSFNRSCATETCTLEWATPLETGIETIDARYSTRIELVEATFRCIEPLDEERYAVRCGLKKIPGEKIELGFSAIVFGPSSRMHAMALIEAGIATRVIANIDSPSPALYISSNRIAEGDQVAAFLAALEFDGTKKLGSVWPVPRGLSELSIQGIGARQEPVPRDPVPADIFQLRLAGFTTEADLDRGDGKRERVPLTAQIKDGDRWKNLDSLVTELPSGRYTIRVITPAETVLARTIDLASDQRLNLDLLPRNKQNGTLLITSRLKVQGARKKSLFNPNRPLELQAPSSMRLSAGVAKELPPGEWDVISGAGQGRLLGTVTVVAGRLTMFSGGAGAEKVIELPGVPREAEITINRSSLGETPTADPAVRAAGKTNEIEIKHKSYYQAIQFTDGDQDRADFSGRPIGGACEFWVAQKYQREAVDLEDAGFSTLEKAGLDAKAGKAELFVQPAPDSAVPKAAVVREGGGVRNVRVEEVALGPFRRLVPRLYSLGRSITADTLHLAIKDAQGKTICELTFKANGPKSPN